MLRLIHQSVVAQSIIIIYMSLCAVLPFILHVVVPGLRGYAVLLVYAAIWYALAKWAVNEELGI